MPFFNFAKGHADRFIKFTKPWQSFWKYRLSRCTKMIFTLHSNWSNCVEFQYALLAENHTLIETNIPVCWT